VGGNCDLAARMRYVKMLFFVFNSCYFLIASFPSHAQVVTLSNVAAYLALAKDALLGEGLRLQMAAFREGFNQFFDIVCSSFIHFLIAFSCSLCFRKS
jgi:hypothetical protein